MKKILPSFLCVAFAVAFSLPAHADVKSVLWILTSQGELGDTGKKTGFFLSKLTHPLEVYEKRDLRWRWLRSKAASRRWMVWTCRPR